MTIGKVENKKAAQTEDNRTHEQKDTYETVAIIKPINVYNVTEKRYTEEINQKSVRVETFVIDILNEKPTIIGYINVSTIEKFLKGEVKAIPIKMRKI